MPIYEYQARILFKIVVLSQAICLLAEHAGCRGDCQSRMRGTVGEDPVGVFGRG